MTAAEAEDADRVSVDVSSEDLFQMQHHHLLNCLEHTTVSLSFIGNHCSSSHSHHEFSLCFPFPWDSHGRDPWDPWEFSYHAQL